MVPGLYQADIATLGTVGAQQQAQTQAEADAAREGKRMQAFEPYERLGFLGQGLTGIMGGYGNQYQFQQQPNPTPLQTALGTGATLAGIYGAVRGAGGSGYNPAHNNCTLKEHIRTMSRTLSRPMFRLGGSTSGITSGLEPKRGRVDGPGGYAGQTIDYDKAFETSQRLTDKFYPRRGADVNRFLINWGLNMVGNPPSGNMYYRPQLNKHNNQQKNFLKVWIVTEQIEVQ